MTIIAFILGQEQIKNSEFLEYWRKKKKSTTNSLFIDVTYVHSSHNAWKFSRAGIKGIKYNIHRNLPDLSIASLVDTVNKNLILSDSLLLLRHWNFSSNYHYLLLIIISFNSEMYFQH